ncbi:MAG: hypothetical protein Q8P56_05640 [Candidatus Uhrbacteria bacterium]|nr:hypothetical protein [Candidatus Uhrbacteria bacterium]
MTHCQNCKKEFEITDSDREFYKKITVPEPTFCPDCRQQRRASWRNEYMLYLDMCALCSKNIVSLYTSDSPYIVYCQQCWWGNGWDGKELGRAFDLSRPFFEQFKELQLVVPRVSLINLASENSEYTNHSSNNKNCYMGLAMGECEECMYGHWIERSRSCIDCLFCKKCESCYECSYCTSCYQTYYSQHCQNMRDSLFCFDCRDCEYVIGSTMQRHQRYMILNEKVSPEEYERTHAELLGSKEKFNEMKNKFDELRLKTPRKFSNQTQCHDATGDDLYNCKNTTHAFNCRNLEDCKYMFDLGDNKDSMDVYEHGWMIPSELVYDSHAGMSGYNIRFSHMCSNGKNQTYTDMCVNDSSDLFGCISLKKSQYCILNKQYTKEEYEVLVPKIIDHMIADGEWGGFFPTALSPFGYNETPAHDHYPLTREGALSRGWKWQDHLPSTKGKETMQLSQMPFSSRDIDVGAYAGQILACEDCQRNYKLLKQEVEFYNKCALPFPRKCSECRRQGRFALRNRRELYHRQCMCEHDGHDHAGRCSAQFETTYALERPELIYCEECYQKEIV